MSVTFAGVDREVARTHRAGRDAATRVRVLLISPQPFFESRGTPLRVLQMLRTLGGAGFDVHLLSYPIGTDLPVPGVTHHRSLAVPGIRAVPVGFSWRKLLLDAAMSLSALRRIVFERWDVVHCVEESIFFALPAARLSGARVIFDLNSSVAHQLEYSGAVRNTVLLRAARALQAAALRHSQLAITVGASLTEEAVRSLGSRIPVADIEDAPVNEALVDPRPALVETLRRELGIGRAPTVVYTGNLAAYQGVELLLEAVPVLAARCPNARVVLVGGEPPEIERIRATLVARGLGDVVLLLGQQPTARMPELMAMADALVSPRREGRNTPLKIYSYMHAGVPIVATALPTHTQVLDRSTAVLCEPTPEALGEALAAVLDRPADFAQLGRAARDRARAQYSGESFARKLLDAYDGLVDGTLSS